MKRLHIKPDKELIHGLLKSSVIRKNVPDSVIEKLMEVAVYAQQEEFTGPVYWIEAAPNLYTWSSRPFTERQEISGFIEWVYNDKCNKRNIPEPLK